MKKLRKIKYSIDLNKHIRKRHIKKYKHEVLKLLDEAVREIRKNPHDTTFDSVPSTDLLDP
jgi:hypothetical protein